MTRHTAEFDAQVKETLQAMYVAGAQISTLRMKILGTVQFFAMGVLMPLGIIAIAIYFDRDVVRNHTLAVTLSAFGLGWGLTLVTRLIYRDMASQTAASPFGQRQRVEMTPEGFTIRTRNSHWFTSWADVSAVKPSKDALCIVVAGVALHVPKSALDEPEEALKDMQGWVNAGVFA